MERKMTRAQALGKAQAKVAARAGVDPKRAFVKGTPEARALMDYVRAARTGPAYSRPITKKTAKRAFNRYYSGALADPTGYGYKSVRGVKAGRTYDLKYDQPIRTHRGYVRNPRRFDFPGVDTSGVKSKRGTKFTASQRAAQALFAKRVRAGEFR